MLVIERDNTIYIQHGRRVTIIPMQGADDAMRQLLKKLHQQGKLRYKKIP